MTKLTLAEKKLLTYLHAIDGVGQGSLRSFLDLKKNSKQNLLNIWADGAGLSHFIKNKKALENYEKFKKEHTINSYWQSLKKKQIKTLFICGRNYPFLLKQTTNPPVLLYLKYGKKEALSLLKASLPVAVVGTRNITAYGRYVTKKLVTELVSYGAVIVSGFMYGVDIQAHQAAVEAGGGTIAVLGFGFDHMFPDSHRPIFNKLLKQNTLFISQFPPATSAQPGNFPVRNAVVAGLSLAVVVTEAAKKSGSHITAQIALDEGRLVAAVPGPIDNPYSEGTKWLINQGATLVTSADDLLDQLNVVSARLETLDNRSQTSSQPSLLQFDSDLEEKAYQALLATNLTTDELAQQLNTDVTRLATVLTSLEMKGLAERVGVSWTGVRVVKS